MGGIGCCPGPVGMGTEGTIRSGVCGDGVSGDGGLGFCESGELIPEGVIGYYSGRISSLAEIQGVQDGSFGTA